MSGTERTSEAIAKWDSQPQRDLRVHYLRSLFQSAKISELELVPNIHLEVMNYDKYMMTVMALHKIVNLANIAENTYNR